MSDFGWKMLIELLKQPVFIGIIIVGILCAIFYNKIIGFFGEFYVKSELKKLSKNYLIINDVMLANEKGTSQIDHLVISPYGIFVIETKKYNGYITGNEYDKKWEYRSGKRKYFINNPIHQNYGHIQTLKYNFDLTDDKFISIISISDTAKIKVNSNSVVYLSNLINTIKQYNKEVLPNYEEIYKVLNKKNITNKSAKNNHVKYVKDLKKDSEVNSTNKCPKCGYDLVERKSKYGSFIGCSNYPKCKYIKKD